MVTLTDEKVNAIRDLFAIVLGELRYEKTKGRADPSDWYLDVIYKEADVYLDKLEELLKEDGS